MADNQDNTLEYFFQQAVPTVEKIHNNVCILYTKQLNYVYHERYNIHTNLSEKFP